jgi:DNA-binding GntR family transcriptional regulator
LPGRAKPLEVLSPSGKPGILICVRDREGAQALSQPVAAVSDGDAGSLATAAYNRLREGILRGDLRPNGRLVETELAGWLNVSRTPLREALARLASDGLVETRRRGWVVREHTAREVGEIHEVRAALEGVAALLACQRASDVQIQEIVDFHHAQNRAKLEMPASDYLVEYNDAFHEAVVVASGNERLRDFIRRNREFFFTYRIARLYTEEEARASLNGHDEVVDALIRRDGERAERAMRQHILEARDVIISKLF